MGHGGWQGRARAGGAGMAHGGGALVEIDLSIAVGVNFADHLNELLVGRLVSKRLRGVAEGVRYGLVDAGVDARACISPPNSDASIVPPPSASKSSNVSLKTSSSCGESCGAEGGIKWARRAATARRRAGGAWARRGGREG